MCLALMLLPDGYASGFECFQIIAHHNSCAVSAKVPSIQMAILVLLSSNLCQDDQYITALHLASELTDPEALAVLLELEDGLACLEMRDRNGLRPLHRAVAHNATKCIQLLVCVFNMM